MLREGRADEAIAVLSRARQSNPRDPNVSNALGLALLYKKDYPAAEKSFNESLQINPDFLEARNNRGVTELEMNRLDDAERDFQAVLDGPQSPERANAHFNLGLVYKKRAQWVDAEREFSLALADSPQMIRALRERGVVRVQLENFHDALPDFLGVLKEDPKDTVSNYNAALCLLAVGRRDLALRYMERAAGGPGERRGTESVALPRRGAPQRARAEMRFHEILDGLLAAPGALAAAFIDPQGQTVAQAGDPAVDRGSRRPASPSGSASWSARRDGPGSAPVQDLSLEFANQRVLSAQVKEGYFLLVVFEAGGLPSFARSRLDEARRELAGEIGVTRAA